MDWYTLYSNLTREVAHEMAHIIPKYLTSVQQKCNIQFSKLDHSDSEPFFFQRLQPWSLTGLCWVCHIKFASFRISCPCCHLKLTAWQLDHRRILHKGMSLAQAVLSKHVKNFPIIIQRGIKIPWLLLLPQMSPYNYYQISSLILHVLTSWYLIWKAGK